MTTNNLASLGIYPIDTIFPSANYKKSGRSMALHYLVALDQPEANIKKWLEKNPQFLNFFDENHFKLTPLAVCVLKQNKNMTEFFLSKGADPTIGDHKGWTPIHHAAVFGNNEILQLLIQKVSEVVAKKLFNFEKGNYQNILSLLNAQNVNPEEMVCYYHEEGNDVTECSAKKFQELTSATYCRSIIITPGELAKRWATKEIAQGHPPVVTEFLEREYQRCLSHPPKISIGKDTSSFPHGFDVFVEEDVKAFQGVTFYGGYLESNPSNPEYLLEDVNGEKFRNFGPMINDGFPNCMCVKVNDHGFRYHLFLAIRDIKKGEKLVWNYGTGHKTKLYSPHFELNPEELEYYVKHNSIATNFKRLVQFFSKTSNDCQAFLNNLAARQRLGYLLETPSSMLYLLSKDLFPIEDVDFVFKQDSMFLFVGFSVEQLEIRKGFAQICCGIGAFLQTREQEGHSQLVKEVQQLLLQWSVSLPVSLIVSFSAYFVNSLIQDIKSLENWSDFKQDLGFYVNFMESLHYYCSNVNEIKHEEFIPKIEENFEKLSKKKKTQGLEDIMAHTANLDTTRKKVLMEMHAKLSKAI